MNYTFWQDRTYECSAVDFFFFKSYGAHRDLPSSPTRPSPDLFSVAGAGHSASFRVGVAATADQRGITYAPGQLAASAAGAGRGKKPAVAIHGHSAYGALLVTDRKSTRLNSSHLVISYAVFCLK